MIKDYLSKIIIESEIVYIDYWSFIHFIAGIILYKKFKLKPIHMVLILVGYEIIELLLVPEVFEPERSLDTLWDIIVGIGGYYFARRKL